MGKRVDHLTWGEERREHSQFKDPATGYMINLTFADYKTLCKRFVEEAELPPNLYDKGRPEGCCKLCWAQYLKDVAEADAVFAYYGE